VIDGLALLIDQERVDIAPLVAGQQILDLFKRGVHSGHAYQS